jgi:hypothetical protein
MLRGVGAVGVVHNAGVRKGTEVGPINFDSELTREVFFRDV